LLLEKVGSGPGALRQACSERACYRGQTGGQCL